MMKQSVNNCSETLYDLEPDAIICRCVFVPRSHRWLAMMATSIADLW